MKAMIPLLFLLAGAAAPPFSKACETTFRLDGTETVHSCFDKDEHRCVDAAKALYEYFAAQPDDPNAVTVAVRASPWRFYGPDMRIMDVDELAASIRPFLKDGKKRVELRGSWTGVAPDAQHKSLADRVAAALGGQVPVSGMDGFLWVDRKGGLRTTHQAFTIRQGIGLYRIHPGDEVMEAFTAGWPIYLEDRFEKDKEADLMMRAGVGWDVFSLCPDHALATFEKAAKMGSAMAAYNAAMMRLDRNGPGDQGAAFDLLTRAAALGDAKAREKLTGMRSM